jgi:methionyl aminopeptidase
VPKDGPPEAGQHFVKAGRVALKPVESNTIILKSPREIAIMREAGKVVARTRRILQETTEPGMTTADLDRIAENEFKQGGAVSTAKGYYGFPGHICVSVNQQVVHGIPGPRKIKQGDVVKVDIAAKRNGYVADTATSFIVGEGTEEAQRLLTVTYDALMRGIEQAKPGNRLSDIGHAIQKHVEANGMSVVRVFVGHGVGRKMHEPPQVPHYGVPGKGVVLKPGMCLAIEPQVNLGGPEVRVLEDQWTAVTLDGRLSAHFEHTIAITDHGPEVLTLE